MALLDRWERLGLGEILSYFPLVLFTIFCTLCLQLWCPWKESGHFTIQLMLRIGSKYGVLCWGRSCFLKSTHMHRVGLGLLWYISLIRRPHCFFLSVHVPGNSPRHSLPPSPPSSYEQDIVELRDTNARLQEQIDNLKVRFALIFLRCVCPLW